MPRVGGNAQDRRRARRKAERFSTRKNPLELTFVTGEVPDEPNFGALLAAAVEDAVPVEHTPDVAPEVSALARLAEMANEDGLTAAGDGFLDLIAEVNASLLEAGATFRAVDAGVTLERVLIFDYADGTSWSAPITIDAEGVPSLSERSEWSPADDIADPDATLESSRAREMSAPRMRFELRQIAFADGALDPTLPLDHQAGERLPERRADVPAPESTVPRSGPVAWTAIFVPEATLTDDGRAFAPGSLSWRELPLSLMAMIETSAQGGHDGALLSGRIDRIWREGSLIMAGGVFDDGEFGQDIARMVGDRTLRGLSVDIAIHEYEVGPRSDYFTEDGVWRDEPPVRAEDAPSMEDMLFGDEVDRVFVVTKGVIGMATVCPFPAFADATISLTAAGAVWRYSQQGSFTVVQRALTASAITTEVTIEDAADEDALTASAAGHAPLAPPAEWFENPNLEELTPLTITDDGRIYGHAWSWDMCHIAFPDSCVLAPRSDTENAYFHLGEIECDGGERLAVGKITLDAPHAGPRLSRAAATSHYDHTGAVAAHVRCGEDEYGGWVAGAIQPELTEAKLRILQGSTLSGDWRNVNGNLELVALLAVNVPGFPVPRTRALIASGDDGQEVLALTAAGIVIERTEEELLEDIAALGAQARG